MKKKSKLKGFTMTEVTITLITIGIIAAISIPNISYRYRTKIFENKVFKAMNEFDSLMKIISHTTRKPSNETINNTLTDNDCAIVTEYLKLIINNNNCVFKTSDDIWWDFSDNDSGQNGIFIKIATSYNDLINMQSKTTNYNNGAFFYANYSDDFGIQTNNSNALNHAPDEIKNSVQFIINRLNSLR